ncbi:Mce associated membrane protein [Mycolicibacterium chitae]|uniref:mammalian cell entry protein n=1 Tax=Mycolicibacterium TaxID=1866885 RepID=UPI000F829A7F|nr:mammalian cell entry protein [Mycolicibacterium chitae]MCV7104969.1 mammalian cell entry protein [Mycolicibacterium chitae]BBZ04234.1 Mce associated membrane protein [Mycolicibacterium chitae]
MGDNASSPDTLTVPADSADDVVVSEGSASADSHVGSEDGVSATPRRRRSTILSLRRPIVIGLAVVVALSGLLGWWGFQAYQIRSAHQDAMRFLQAARQAALNLTTIDWQRADDDVKRIMETAGGEFHDEFAQRAQPFVEVVKQAQSVSVGTITEAALESQAPNEAQALIAVSVQTTSTAGAEPAPRAWRMRISVQELDGQIKVSRVEFVP